MEGVNLAETGEKRNKLPTYVATVFLCIHQSICIMMLCTARTLLRCWSNHKKAMLFYGQRRTYRVRPHSLSVDRATLSRTCQQQPVQQPVVTPRRFGCRFLERQARPTDFSRSVLLVLCRCGWRLLPRWPLSRPPGAIAERPACCGAGIRAQQGSTED